MGSALAMVAEEKFATKAKRAIASNIAYLRAPAQLSGSAGSADGAGTRRISSWDVSWLPVVVRSRTCSVGWWLRQRGAFSRAGVQQ